MAGGLDHVGKDLDGFEVHGTDPQTFESARQTLGTSAVTAIDEMFVRNVLPAPSADELRLDDRDAWVLEVTGVARPGSLTLAELKQLGDREVTTVLQCSGNGRTLFDHDAPGTPWGVGAVANSTWTGVPLRAVVEAHGGVAADARFLTATGGESIPDDVDERKTVVERSIPVDKALDDCVLAWDLDHTPIPRAHGAPLRLIVPGYYGVNQIKYVKRIAFTAHESDAWIQTTAYRTRPVGEAPHPDQPSMWEMNVKSLVARPVPGERRAPGRLVVEGVAYGGEAPVDRVEVSVDGGRTWADARLVDDDLGPTAWRRWSYEIEAGVGRLEIVSRAHDRADRTQPEHAIADAEGYGHNGWRDHLVTCDVAAAAST